MKRVLRGYEPAEVEAFLDRCVAALRAAGVALPPELQGRHGRGRPPTRDEVSMVTFSRCFRGYPLDEVDDLLDRVAAALPG